AIAGAAPMASLSYAKTTGVKAPPVRIYGTFLNRTGAGLVDAITAFGLALLVSVGLVAAFGDVIELDDPIIPLAIEKTIESDLGSREIVAGGAVVRNTQHAIIERNFF